VSAVCTAYAAIISRTPSRTPGLLNTHRSDRRDGPDCEPSVACKLHSLKLKCSPKGRPNDSQGMICKLHWNWRPRSIADFGASESEFPCTFPLFLTAKQSRRFPRVRQVMRVILFFSCLATSSCSLSLVLRRFFLLFYDWVSPFW
jgi:hypothetical protein